MAFQSHRTRFKGDLAGIKQEKIAELDYTRENIKERLEYINKKYSYVRNYHEEYTSDYYKVNVNTDDNLSSDINIFKSIERDGSYLLNSLDQPRDKQHKYNILTQEEFDRIIKKEEKGDITDDAYKNILKPAFKNDYIGMDLKITKKDLEEDSETGEVLRQYNKVKTHLNEENIKLKNGQGSYLNVYQITLLSGTINCDMLDTKKMLNGIMNPAKKLGDIGSKPDFNSIKYSNPAHVKAIITSIRFEGLQPNSELSHLAHDIDRAIKELHKNGKLDDLDLEIVDCLNSGMSERATAEELGKGKTTIQQRISKICERVALFYSYINIEKLE